MSDELLQVVLGRYDKFLRERDLALSRRRPHLVREVAVSPGPSRLGFDVCHLEGRRIVGDVRITAPDVRRPRTVRQDCDASGRM